MNSRVKRYVAITALGLVYGTMFNLPYIKYVFYDAMIDGMGVSNTKLGLLLTVYTIVSTAGLLPGGWIADRFKTKGIIVGSAFLNGIICFFFMFTMKNYACAMITWIVSAIAGVTAFWAAILKAVRLISPEDEQGRPMDFGKVCAGCQPPSAISWHCMFSQGLTTPHQRLKGQWPVWDLCVSSAVYLYGGSMMRILLPQMKEEKRESR